MIQRYLPRLRFLCRALQGAKPVRVAFLHIPKCAGSSIHVHFKANYGSQRSGRTVLLDTMHGSADDPAVIARARAALYVSGHFGWRTLATVGQSAFRFTVLRDPVERLRSLFRYAASLGTSNHPGFAALARSSQRRCFEEFCLDAAPLARAMLDNAQTRTLAHDYHPLNACDAAATLRAAKANLDELDLVCEADALSQVLPCIAQRTSTSIVPAKTHVNRSRETEAGAPITTRDFLADSSLSKLVALDMDLLEHARGLRFFAPGALAAA